MSSIAAGTTTTTALVSTADTTGSLVLKTGASATTALTLDTSQNATFAGTVTTVTGAVYPLVSGTAQNSTSGTAINFTGVIPSTATRITVLFRGVSANADNPFIIQIGTGGVATTSGYLTTSSNFDGTIYQIASYTTGFLPMAAPLDRANLVTGISTICKITGNTWVFTGDLATTTALYIGRGTGYVTLSGTLDFLRVINSSTASPSGTFDAGVINIMWE